jgi:5-methylcytosine-specific restriction endonuclease McrA
MSKRDYTSVTFEIEKEAMIPLDIIPICPICKKQFLSNSKSRKYCSPKCAEKATKKVRDGFIPTFLIFARDGFRCHYCGKSPHTDPNVSLIVDHIIPLSKGGTSTEENLISCCHQCNAEKGHLLLEPKIVEFLKH